MNTLLQALNSKPLLWHSKRPLSSSNIQLAVSSSLPGVSLRVDTMRPLVWKLEIFLTVFRVLEVYYGIPQNPSLITRTPIMNP